ncbi:MAG TPA: hypothetical protein VGW40_06060 [Allosphingosinicella sp.]|nr:hypothetical protein [Allosphingosinicella sp.]
MLGLEVTQAVQDVAHHVVLIRGKATVVRAYVVPGSALPRPIRVTGELTWRALPGGATGTLMSVRPVDLPAGAPAHLDTLRDREARSLNFVLPAEALSGSSVELRLNRVTAPGGEPAAPLAGNRDATVRLEPGVPLRIRVIGLRYKDELHSYEPDDLHFRYIRSWLGRAYPVPSVEWSQLTVDAKFSPPFEQPTQVSGGTAEVANSQIAALRAADLATGTHPRTHYYGLVSDGSRDDYFVRGLAFSIPQQPDPTAVASGPAGAGGGFFGDEDESYADWYCGHELGHTFGRYHPGFPPPDVEGGQTKDDLHFPYDDGRISGADPRFVGFDVGDQALGQPMRALPGSSWHDVMTYMPLQWVSPYTYQALYRRIQDEARLHGS